MESTNSETKVTQSGQAIAINNICCTQLFDLFAPMFGPNGSIKALVSPGLQLNLTKDGSSLCRDIQFTHPTSIMITRAATSVSESTGDGSIFFVLLMCECFKEAYRLYGEGTQVQSIINSMQLALKDINEMLVKKTMPLNERTLRQLALSSLKTKVRKPDSLVEIVLKALGRIGPKLDTNMIEVMKMEEGDISESIFVEGLVLDHGTRHHAMPTSLENVCVVTTNMSLEYEKPEINAEFCYSSAAQRERLASSEREFISQKARRLAELAVELRKEGRSLLVVSEKGIDMNSLEILANAGVIALRRAKRRNLERLISMCGGRLVTEVSQLSKESLGLCQKVRVTAINENKYTFIEGTALRGSCTILLRGNTDFERMNRSIKGTLNLLASAVRDKCCVAGGMPLYKDFIRMLEEKIGVVHEADVVGYKVLAKGFESLIKVLLRNGGVNVNEGLARVLRGDWADEGVVENVKAVNSSITNAVYMVINLLMCDEIILAGKPVNQGK